MNIFSIINLLLILSGSVVMFFAIISTAKILREIKSKPIAKNWKILIFLMIFFLFGYMAAAYMVFSGALKTFALITGVVFFFGALFVLIASLTSRKTISELLHTASELQLSQRNLEKLAKEQKSSIESSQSRINNLMEVMLKITVLDFSARAPISEKKDKLDAIAIGINTMVEELQSHKKKLEESEEKYRNLIEQASDVVYSSDYNGYFTYINPSCEKLLGYTSGEIVGKHFSELIPPEWKDKVAQFYLNQFNNKIKETLFAFPVLTKSGEQKWIEQTVLQLRDDGKITGHHCIVRDITGRKKLEDQLKESEEKFQKAFQAGPAGMNIIRLSDSKYIEVNEAFIKMIGFSKEELIGHSSVELGMLMVIGRREEILRQIKEQGSAKNFEMSISDKEGKIIEVIASSETILLKGEKYALNIFYDITERKKNEEKILNLNNELEKNIEMLKIANTELEAFSFSVSHDLRAPIRAISGFSGIMKKNYSEKFDENGKTMLSMIDSEAVRMGKLIDDLLSFSRTGRKELQKSLVDMTLLAKSVADEVLRLAEEKYNAKITVKDLLPSNADSTLIHQVFVNLISNALKFSKPKTEPEIEIGSFSEPNENVYFVKDNGVGFDMKFYDKLFVVFQRLHSTEDFKGTGIGLAIVKRIISRHGGRVWAEGKVNEGATFYFSLPK